MAADLVASRRIRHEPVHAGVVGQVAHHDRIADAGRMEVLFLAYLAGVRLSADLIAVIETADRMFLTVTATVRPVPDESDPR